MNLKNKKILIVASSIFLGIVIGLVLASNFNFTQNGFAENRIEQPAMNTEAALTPNEDLESTSRAFVAIAKRVTPTVVSITSEKVVKVRDPFSNFFHNDDFFKRFFRTPNGDGERERKQQGLGSGVIVSPEGYILTNYHVVKDADEVNVVIDKKSYDAEIVGTDPASDLAVVKIHRTNLPSIRLGDSDKLEVGEWVLAIGNPFSLNLSHTVTSGIISAKGRSLNLSRELTYQDFIQTDAAINPGNSGGALVNIRGELVGINSAIYAGNGGGNVGIGFAIPINLAKRVMDDLISKGKVVRGYLGVYIETPDEELSQALHLKENHGAVVTKVVEGTPADRAGLKEYDVIVAVNGKAIDDHQSLTNLIASYPPDETVTLTIIRDGKRKKLDVTLEERPGSPEEKSDKRSQSDISGRLGIDVTNLTDQIIERFGYENVDGVFVTNVASGSVAEEKGLQRGDLIVQINKKRVKSVRDFEKIIGELRGGDIVLFQVRRQDNNHFIAMKVPEK